MGLQQIVSYIQSISTPQSVATAVCGYRWKERRLFLASKVVIFSINSTGPQILLVNSTSIVLIMLIYRKK